MMFPALAAAIGASAGYGVASVLEAWAARRASGVRVFMQPAYLAGIGLDLVAWLASLLALQRLTLFTVQALLAGSLVVTILLARWVFSTRLTGAQILLMLLLVAALAVIALATGEQPVAAVPAHFDVLLLVSLAVLVLVLVPAYRRRQPVLLATVAGTAASVAALGARGMQLSGALGEILLQPLPWIVLGCGVATMVAYTRALEYGPVGAVTALYTVIEVAVPGTIGMLALGDTARPGWEVYKFAAIALGLSAGVWLALNGGTQPDIVQASSRPRPPTDSQAADRRKKFGERRE